MAQKNKEELKEASDVIRQETQEGANTKLRVANVIDDLIDSLLGFADLDNVDNTSDLDKPISTATQEALDGKYDASNPLGFITADDIVIPDLTKEAIGLGNVDNTSDANKPISNAVASALSEKADKLEVANFETTTQLNTRDFNNRNRANHTGTQPVSTISGFQDAVSANASVSANTAKRTYPEADQTKLSGIQAEATKNDTDDNLKNRANHIGSQPASTISDFSESVQNIVPLRTFNVDHFFLNESGEISIAEGATGVSYPEDTTKTEISFEKSYFYGTPYQPITQSTLTESNISSQRTQQVIFHQGLALNVPSTWKRSTLSENYDSTRLNIIILDFVSNTYKRYRIEHDVN